MSTDDSGRPSGRVLSKGRMEGFSDGVFGFASTLLVLDLAIRPPGDALQQVLHGWTSYVAYLVSFMTIGVAWLGHTRLTDRLASVDPILLRLNLLLLFVVVFLPFPTRLAAAALHDASGERVRHDVRTHAAHHLAAGLRDELLRDARGPILPEG